MRIIIPAVAVIGTALTATLLTAAPATAAPPGCSFYRGTLTCVTTTTVTRAEGPFSTGGFVKPDVLTDGFDGYRICEVVSGQAYPRLAAYDVNQATFDVETTTTTTTTTTVQRGASRRSPVRSSTTTTARQLVGVHLVSGGCLILPTS